MSKLPRSTILLPVFIPAAVVMILLVLVRLSIQKQQAHCSVMCSITSQRRLAGLYAGRGDIFDVYHCAGVFALWQY